MLSSKHALKNYTYRVETLPYNRSFFPSSANTTELWFAGKLEDFSVVLRSIDLLLFSC